MSDTLRKRLPPEDWLIRHWIRWNYDVVRELHKHFGDRRDWRQPPKDWRRMHWQMERQEARRQIHRWSKDHEFEVQLRGNPRWPYWD